MNKLGDLLIKHKMSDKTFSFLLNFWFIMIALIGNMYLMFIFTFTKQVDFKFNFSLIAPLITFALGIGLKAILSFILITARNNYNEDDKYTRLAKHFIDGMSALTFFAYIKLSLKGSEFEFLINFITFSTIISITLFVIYRIPRKLEEKRNKKNKLK